MGFVRGLAGRLFDRIGSRIAIVLAVALLPLAVISANRTTQIAHESQARSEAALAGETLRSISRELRVIEKTRGVAFALASTIGPVRDDPVACSAIMREMVEKSVFSFAAFFARDGVATCVSADAPVTFSDSAAFARNLEEAVPVVRVNRDAPISMTSVIYATEPVFDAAGAVVGIVAVSVPHSAIAMTEGETPFGMWPDTAPDVAFVTFNAAGEVLTVSGAAMSDIDGYLPQDVSRADLLERRQPFTARSAAGDQRSYAVLPILGSELFALGTWPERDVLGASPFLRMPALFPALMWIASLIVAYFAAELFVTRDVRRLRRSIRAFGTTRRSVGTEDFSGASLELRDMAASYADMTDKILREEAALEDTVRQKDVLLREVHHRVKNNLQLIASIMNMQMRKSRSEEARTMMRGLHDRVMSLATVHRGLYQTSGLADVCADELLSDILTQITHLSAAPEGSIAVEQDFDTLRLTPEQAVPLSLAVTEALTNAIKYSGNAPGEKTGLRLSLRAADVVEGQARPVVVEVANTMPPGAAEAEPGPLGLGTQLLTAFSQQLHGTVEKRTEGNWFIVSLTFDADPLGQQSDTANVF